MSSPDLPALVLGNAPYLGAIIIASYVEPWVQLTSESVEIQVRFNQEWTESNLPWRVIVSRGKGNPSEEFHARTVNMQGSSVTQLFYDATGTLKGNVVFVGFVYENENHDFVLSSVDLGL